MLVLLYNDTCVKYSMETQAYKVVNTYAHEISVWTILSILLHSHAPHLGGMNGGVKSDLTNLAFKNEEQLECFSLYNYHTSTGNYPIWKTFSPNIFIFRYMKTFSKSDKIKAFIASIMSYLIRSLGNNRKLSVKTGGVINGLYRYLNISRSPTTLKLLKPQLHWPLKVSAITILFLNLQPTFIKQLSTQLLHISSFDRRLFANDV